MSSSLLPHFKWQPDTFSVISKLRTPTSIFHSKHKAPVCFSVHGIISSTRETALLTREELKIPSFDAASLASYQSLTYFNSGDHSNEAIIGSTLATESFINDDHTIIAAAASKALALAQAAANLAKEVELMTNGGRQHVEHGAKCADSLSDGDIDDRESISLLESERSGHFIHSLETETSACCGYSKHYPLASGNDCVEPTTEELELLQSQPSAGIAVRSKRQVERKAKRARAAEKTAATIPVISCPSRRKRSVQEVDHSDPLRYIRETAKTKLLTASEELELSEGIQDLLKLEKLYKQLDERGGCHPTFEEWAAAAGDDRKTFRKRLNYGIQCKDTMIRSNIRLVISIAKKYQGAGMNLMDLIQEGCRGLVRGVEKFDPSKGFKFSTFAHCWIKQAVRKSLSDKSRTIRVPYYMVDAKYKVREARKRLYDKTGQQPDNEELAEATGLSMKRLSAVLMTPKATLSLDQKTGFNDNFKPTEGMADPNTENAEDLLIKKYMKLDLEKVLDTLTRREQQVIKWRFGMEDGREKTLQEVGEVLGLTRERVRQIEFSALQKLMDKNRTKHLKQYLFL